MPNPLRRVSFAAVMAGAALGSAATVVASDAAGQWSSGRPWLGVAMDQEAPSDAGVDARPPGIRVIHVVRRSPADLAGIREGDRLVRVAGSSVARGADVVHVVSASSVGDGVDVSFVRAGKELSTRVTLAPYPSQDDMMRMDLVGASAPTWRDVEAVHGVFPASIGALRGRVVLLDFWATWCVPCRIVVPKLGALQARYGAEGLSVLGVSTEDAEDVALFAQKAAMRYAVAVDKHAETTRSYGVVSLPTLVAIDRRGVVRDLWVGYDPAENARLEASVRHLLAEAAN